MDYVELEMGKFHHPDLPPPHRRVRLFFSCFGLFALLVLVLARPPAFPRECPELLPAELEVFDRMCSLAAAGDMHFSVVVTLGVVPDLKRVHITVPRMSPESFPLPPELTALIVESFDNMTRVRGCPHTCEQEGFAITFE